MNFKTKRINGTKTTKLTLEAKERRWLEQASDVLNDITKLDSDGLGKSALEASTHIFGILQALAAAEKESVEG